MARVLLVDDDPGAHDTIHPILRLARHECAGALTGREGIRIAKEYGPDVVLVDIRLPDISGIEVIAALRKEMPLVACIAMTSHMLYEYATEALRAGACDWLEKPAWEEEILSAVKKALCRRASAGGARSRSRTLRAARLHTTCRDFGGIHQF